MDRHQQVVWTCGHGTKHLPKGLIQLLGMGAADETQHSTSLFLLATGRICAARSCPVIDTLNIKLHMGLTLRSIQEVINCPILNGGYISKGIKPGF